MRRIRIAQIGTSQYSHGRQIFKSLARQNDLFEIAGYALPQGEREKYPKTMAAFEGYQELSLEEILNDPTIQAVTIETEEQYLTHYALLAAKAGKHIHMEKPGGTDPAAFEELISLVKEKGLVFHVGYMYRYNPAIQQLLEEIKAGQLGEIISVEAQMNCIHPPQVREYLAGLPGGMMFFLGCHLIDLLVQLQGLPQTIIPMNKGADFGFVLLEYPNGVSFAKCTATEIGGYYRRQLVVHGSKKTVELKPLEIGLPNDMVATGVTTYTDPAWKTPGAYEQTPPFNRYDGMMAAFAKMVTGQCPNPRSYQQELALYQTIMKCCGVK